MKSKRKTKNNKKKIFIGAAWPYANGHLHLGHLAGVLGSDFLARYFRLKGNDVLFVSGSDCHGTPISVRAEKEKTDPANIANRYHNEFKEIFKKLEFSYDLYSKTTSDTHHRVVQEIFLYLYKNGFIYKKTENLPYCLECERFLPDRYVEGVCPNCGDTAMGDQCDGCGKILDPAELEKQRCKICGDKPEWKESEHFFFKLSHFQSKLSEWAEKSKGWRRNARNSTLGFLKSEKLRDRSITRDINWGIPVPLSGYEGKSIYVWFEAVCGYLSASKEWAEKILKKNDAWKTFWQENESIHYYVHGKDNILFHTIIWPAILLACGKLKLPDRIVSSEYLNLEGKKFSKSNNWAVWLPEFLADFDPETIRFYVGMNGPENADADFSWREYAKKVNSELIGKFGNLVNRILFLINKNFPDGVNLSGNRRGGGKKLLDLAKETFSSMGSAIEEGKFRESLKLFLKLVDRTNAYLEKNEPWKAVEDNTEKAENDLAVTANVVKCLSVLIHPFLPKSAENIASYINFKILENGWNYPTYTKVKVDKKPVPLYRKIENSIVEEKIALLKKQNKKKRTM